MHTLYVYVTCGSKHNETYRTQLLYTGPLPKVPLVPSNVMSLTRFNCSTLMILV